MERKECPICKNKLKVLKYPFGDVYQCEKCVYYYYILADSLKKVIGDTHDRF